MMLRRAIFSVLTVSAMFAGLEGVGRAVEVFAPSWVAPFQDTWLDGARQASLMHPDSALLWRMPPAETHLSNGVRVRVNGWGLRGDEPRPDVDGVADVVFLGDSSVFGWGVEERDAFPWRVERRLNTGGHPVHVINGGTPGYSSAQARFQVDELLQRVRPEVVVVATLWSDMMRSTMTDAELFARVGSPRHARTLAGRSWLARSAFYRLLEARIVAARALPSERRISWSTVLEGDPTSDKARVPVDRYADNLSTIVGAAHAAGAVVIPLILPANRSGEHAPYRALQPYHSELHAIAGAAGAVDMDAAWSQLPADGLSDLFIDRVHPSAAGHERIALALTPVVRDALSRQ